MVRGTNKMIIEINDVDNQFFERAVLYVRDKHAAYIGPTLEQQAEHYIATVKGDGRLKIVRAGRWMRFTQILLSGLGGAVLTLLLTHFIA